MDTEFVPIEEYLRPVFAMKPPQNEKEYIEKKAEKRVGQFWVDIVKTFKNKYPVEFWQEGEQWFLDLCKIKPHHLKILVHAEYLKLYAEAVVDWEHAMRKESANNLHSFVGKLMEECGIVP
ncbi:MAG: hypothetical protein Q9226_006544 [Calogaya cf. arnoldii]